MILHPFVAASDSWRGQSPLARLASLKLTLLLIVCFALAVMCSYGGLAGASWLMALPLALLALNLAAAVATRPIFRRQRALLVFHLGLIAIVLLLAAGRMSYLRGTVEVTEGAEFDGQLGARDAGPWHWGALEQVHFSNGGFQIAYGPGVERDRTRNAVDYLDADGQAQHAEIGDQTPLVLRGYRFYTSPNKGFAPTFAWYPANGKAPVLGAVHLPSYPVHQYRQAREWQLPESALRLWTMLSFDEVILDPARASEFRLPKAYTLVVRIGALRRELRAGESIELPGGRLEYAGLRTWMGYTVFYDQTIGMLLAACMVSVIALGWHLARKYAARPWNPERA
ncbi:MAG: cytochrome c biogenesis protein ResB [Pseudomonadota bacterium]